MTVIARMECSVCGVPRCAHHGNTCAGQTAVTRHYPVSWRTIRYVQADTVGELVAAARGSVWGRWRERRRARAQLEVALEHFEAQGTPDAGESAVDLLRQVRGYIADHVTAHPADQIAAKLWSDIDGLLERQ